MTDASPMSTKSRKITFVPRYRTCADTRGDKSCRFRDNKRRWPRRSGKEEGSFLFRRGSITRRHYFLPRDEDINGTPPLERPSRSIFYLPLDALRESAKKCSFHARSEERERESVSLQFLEKFPRTRQTTGPKLFPHPGNHTRKRATRARVRHETRISP